MKIIEVNRFPWKGSTLLKVFVLVRGVEVYITYSSNGVFIDSSLKHESSSFVEVDKFIRSRVII